VDQRFRGGLVFKAHRLVHPHTLTPSQAVWADIVSENEWVLKETSEIKEAMRGDMDSLYWREQVVSNRNKRQLMVCATLEATHGQILSNLPQMPPDSGGIFMGVD